MSSNHKIGSTTKQDSVRIICSCNEYSLPIFSTEVSCCWTSSCISGKQLLVHFLLKKYFQYCLDLQGNNLGLNILLWKTVARIIFIDIVKFKR